MSTPSEIQNEAGSPPAWLLPLIAVTIIGIAAVIGVLLTRPPTPQTVAPAPQAAEPVATAHANITAAAVPLAHGEIDPNGPSVERIDLAGARAHFDAQTAVFIDVRSGAEYTAGHIAGALSLTSPEVETRLRDLPPESVVIAYGDASKPDSAVRAAQIFMELGYPQVIAMDGGWQAWEKVGFPISNE
jgi:rhodanese-related sulfurtransferase